MSLDKDKIK